MYSLSSHLIMISTVTWPNIRNLTSKMQFKCWICLQDNIWMTCATLLLWPFLSSWSVQDLFMMFNVKNSSLNLSQSVWISYYRLTIIMSLNHHPRKVKSLLFHLLDLVSKAKLLADNLKLEAVISNWTKISEFQAKRRAIEKNS